MTSLLSPRELEVMEAMSSGATNSEIAARLVITEDTVKSHVKRILAKLGASNRVDAVSRFVRAVVEQELLAGSLDRVGEVHSIKR
jgi:DNA-binding NarL/FixJ family response regulator